MSPSPKNPIVRPFLERLYERYHEPAYLESDPLEFVHRYADPWDREAVAVVSALLAYGNVRQIRRSVADALGRMEKAGGPAALVRSLRRSSGRKAALAEFATWVHRFNRGEDLVLLLELVSLSWQRYGSLGAHFLQHGNDEDPTFERPLNRLLEDWERWLSEGKLGTWPPSKNAGAFSYFVTPPARGSACKRWCMLLRWMGRRDRLDPGLWGPGSGLASTFPKGRFLHPHQLVMPLDTHTGRISRYLGLTRRQTLGWKAALEITAKLKSWGDPQDPVRYDFALARLGILDRCQRRYRKEICEGCEVLPVCQYARRRGARAGTPERRGSA